MKGFGRASLLALAALAASPGAGLGDVTVERFHRSGGIMGLGASESTVVVKLSGAKKRETAWIRPTGAMGKVIGTLAGAIVTDEITVVPEDAVRNLDHGKKSYGESRILVPKAKEEPGRAGKERREKPKVRVVRNEVDVRETGERKAIHGFDCRQHIASWVIETEDGATGKRSRTTMTNDLWFTPETKQTRALRREERAFVRAWLEKAGPDAADGGAGRLGLPAVAGLFGGNEEDIRGKLRELRRKIAGIGGYPIVSGVKWETETTKEARPGIGSLLEGAAQRTTGEKTQGNGKPGEEGETVLFALYTEIRKIDLSPVPRSEFKVPRGYRREK